MSEMSEDGCDSDSDPEPEVVCIESSSGSGSVHSQPLHHGVKTIKRSSAKGKQMPKRMRITTKLGTSDVSNMSVCDSDEEPLKHTKSEDILTDKDDGSEPRNPIKMVHVKALQKSLMTARNRFEKEPNNDSNVPSTSKGTDSNILGIVGTSIDNDNKYMDIDCTTKTKKEKLVKIPVEKMFANKQTMTSKQENSVLENEFQYFEYENQAILHKAHLLCLLAHGLYVNSKVIKSNKVFKFLFTELPQHLKDVEHVTQEYVQKLLHWFAYRYRISPNTPASGTITDNHLETLFLGDVHKRKKYSLKDLVMLFVLLLRGIGVETRFVMSLQPIPISSESVFSDISLLNNLSNPKNDDIEDIYKPGPSGTQKIPKDDKNKVHFSNVEVIEILSTDSEGEEEEKKDHKVVEEEEDDDDDDNVVSNILGYGIDHWIEIYLKGTNKWMSLDVYSLELDCPSNIYARCTKPAAYIVGWENDNHIKEVTRRYTPMWHIAAIEGLDKIWFEKTLRPFLNRKKKEHELEEAELDDIETEMNDAIPKVISELQYHPRYAAVKYLADFECIYPEDAVPVGYINNEPIYSRYCVHLLRDRVDWLKQGKAIKANENPYKSAITDTNHMALGTDVLTDLYGPWQVEDYVPPPVIDGIVPKNEFGTIELYKPTMLPAGTVHLKVPGIFKIANEINIDCARAVVGWRNRSGKTLPIISGVVVCKENEDLLLDAWNSPSWDHVRPGDQTSLTKEV